ncbi:MAG: AEC family transporter [Deltaproteobacteria bacterium]|nr:AEC family transporter [Deltaproteobacteria bacterium]
MIKVAETIIPIFMLIMLGGGARHFGFMRPEFMAAANRLVFYLAIPALVFRALSRASLRAAFDPWSVVMMGVAVFMVGGLGLLSVSLVGKKDGPRQGTFTQTTIHGNLGYIGLAVAYYYLDESGFARAGMMLGFLMILQNLLGVVLLQYFCLVQEGGARRLRRMLISVILNPVILAALTGMLFNLSALPLPSVLDRFLLVLSGLALPMGLLLIGASISFALLKRWLLLAGLSAFYKLLLLPATGLLLFRLAGVGEQNYVPGLILLAAPTATLTYVMAREMGGLVELSVASISLSTLLSAFTYALWLGWLAG